MLNITTVTQVGKKALTFGFTTKWQRFLHISHKIVKKAT